MKTTKIRHQFLLEAGLSEKLASLCRHPGTAKGDVIAKAIEAFLERRGASELDERYAKRLDRLSHDLANVRRDVEMILESLALFIRFSITLNAHTPMPDKATQAIAHERFMNFVDEVGRRIARGKKPFEANGQTEEP